MSPILGIWASANQSQYISTAAFESIATVAVGAGGSTTITFSSIPSTYKHLQLRVTEQTNVYDKWRAIYFNGDTNYANYWRHSSGGDGASTSASGFSTDWLYYEALSGHSSISMAGYIIDILDYSNTSKNKTLRFLGGHDNNGSGNVGIVSKSWSNTSAINSISMTISGGGANWVQYSNFALYGIK